MEVSALTHAGVAGTHARSPLLRLQTDERLIALIRRGNQHAFEALVARYQSRLLAFCRHMLSSREDAEDVLQEVFAAAFNAILADERPINVRPWLYRIARNRSLNHMRKAQAIGVDSMDVHLSEHGLTTADKVHKREEFRQLMSDVGDLPETQRTALLLREIDALSYDQIAEAMETTVPSVKSLLVRARVSLAEAAEARLLTCEEVRDELGEVAEGLRRTTPPARRHLRSCERCQVFRKQLRQTNRALAAIFPVGPLLLLKKVLFAHAGTAAAGSGGAAAAGSGAAAAGAAGAAGAAAGGMVQAGAGALASKAVAGLAAAAIVTAGAVEVNHVKDRPGKGQRGEGREGRSGGAGRGGGRRRAGRGRLDPAARLRAGPGARRAPGAQGPREEGCRQAGAGRRGARDAGGDADPGPDAHRHAGADRDAGARGDHGAAAGPGLRPARGRHGDAPERARRGPAADGDRLAAAAVRDAVADGHAGADRHSGADAVAVSTKGSDPSADSVNGSARPTAPLSAAPAG